MSIEQLLAVLLGGGGFAGVLAHLFTRITSKEQNGLDMLDRAQKELERTDNKNIRLENEKRNLEKEIHEKNGLLRDSEFERKKLLYKLDRVIEELDETKNEAVRLREKVKELEKEGR